MSATSVGATAPGGAGGGSSTSSTTTTGSNGATAGGGGTGGGPGASSSIAISILPAPSIQLARALEATTLEDLSTMSAYQLFQKQIESGSTEASLDAMKRLSVVSITMGPEAIQTQLLPYLTALVTQTSTLATSSAATATALAAAQQSGGVGNGNNGGTNNATTTTTSIPPPPSDEWLLLLAQELKLVARYYLQSAHNNNNSPPPDGGGNKYLVEDFLPILERLAAVEETVVREEAVSVFAEIARRAAQQQQQQQYLGSSSSSSTSVWMALIKRLVNADWFTPKVSAAGILPHLFAIVHSSNGGGNVPPTEKPDPLSSSSLSSPGMTTTTTPHPVALELLALYKELCTDETPMVRRAAAQHLGTALAHSGWAYREDGLAATTLTRLCHDEQDSVRRLAVVALADVTPSYAQQSPQWTAQYWLPLLKDASTDLSWYVI